MHKKHPIAWSIGTLVVLLIALFFFLPALLSTRWGTGVVSRIVSSRIPGSVVIEDLELHWFGSQVVDRVTLLEPTDEATIKIERIESSASLWSLLWGKRSLGTVTISAPEVLISYDVNGRSSLRRALGLRASCPPAPIATLGPQLGKRTPRYVYAGTYLVKRGTVQTQAPQLGTVTFSDIEAHLMLSQDFQDVNLGCTLDGDGGHAYLSVEHARLLPSGYLLPGEGFTVHGEAEGLPVAGLDAIVSVAHPPMLGLLTAFLGPYLTARVAENQGDLTLGVTTANVQGDLSATFAPGRMQLTQPARVVATITPAASDHLFPLLPLAEQLRTQKPTDLVITVPEFIGEWTDSLHTLTGHGEATLGKTEFYAPHIGAFSLDSFVMKGQASGQGDTAEVSAEAGFTCQESQGELKGHAHVTRLLTSEASTSWSVHAHQFPTPLLEPLVQHEGLIPALLGPHLSLSLTGVADPQKGSFTLSASSDTLTVAPTHFRVSDALSLTEPTHIGYTVRNQAWEALLGPDFPVHLRQPATTGVVFNALEIPLVRSNPNRTKLVGAFAAPTIALTGLPGQGDITLNDLHIRLIGDSVATGAVEAATELYLPDEDGIWNQAIGDTLPASLEAHLAIRNDWTVDLPHIALWIQSRLLSIEGVAALYDFQQLKLLSPLDIHYTLTPQITPTLDKPADIHLEIAPWDMNLANLHWQSAHLSCTASAEALTFSGPLHPEIKALKGSFVLNDPLHHARATFSGKTTTVVSKEAGVIKGSFTADHLFSQGGIDWQGGRLKGDATLEKMPTGALGLVLHQPHLTELLGPLTSLLVSVDLKPIYPSFGEMTLTAQSDHLHLFGDLHLGDSISLADPNKPVRLKWTCTPEAFAALTPKGTVKLADSSTYTAELTRLNWPRGEATCCAELALQSQLSNVTLTANGGKEKISFEEVTLDVHAEGTSKPADLQLAGSLHTHDDSTPGHFAALATVDQFLGPQAYRTLHLDATAHLDGVSVPWLIRLAPSIGPLENPLALALGSSLTANAAFTLAAWEGPLSLTLEADHARATIDGTVKEGVLVLTHPLEGKVEITPELGSVILQAFNPLLMSSMRSEKWATFTIDPKGFQLPLAPLDLGRLSIGHGTIDLGKMWIAQKGTIRPLLQLFPHSHAASQNEIRAWATPAYFSAQKGDISVERWDLLLDRSLQVASWGHANLARNSVRLKLALPGYSLRKVLGIDAIPTEEYLIIPVRGTLQETKIDWTRAAAGVAALIAQARGGTAGRVTGLALDVLTGARRDKTKVPPPTTTPFPWAEEVTWPPYKAPSSPPSESESLQ